jgi:hypothetical protein
VIRFKLLLIGLASITWQAGCSDPEDPEQRPNGGLDAGRPMNDAQHPRLDQSTRADALSSPNDATVQGSPDADDRSDSGGEDGRCLEGNGGCDINADCRDTGAAVECICRTGYQGDGQSCQDVDECLRENGGCGAPGMVECVNQDGGPPRCVDVDECAVDNGGCGDSDHVACTNNDRAAPTCSDVDECLVNNGACGPATDVTCVNADRTPPICQPFNLADLWAGRARFDLDDNRGQIAWNGFHFLSTVWHEDVLYAYTITNYLAGETDRAVVGFATSEDGLEFDGQGVVMDIGGAWQWVYEAADNPHHSVGREDQGGWAAGVDDGPPNYLAFGPYAVLPPGPMTVSFELMVDVVDASDDRVLTLDVFDATSQEILVSRDITRHQFNGPLEYTFFDLHYRQAAGHQIEYRVYWHRSSYVRLGRRAVSQGQPPFADERIASFPGVWRQEDTWYLVYECAGLVPEWPGDVCLSTSSDGITWHKDPHNPILTHQPDGWERSNIGTPSLWFEEGVWYLFYHGFDGSKVQVGLASGASLSALQRHPQNPLLRTTVGAWDAGTVGKRSIIREGAWYYMAYEGSTEKRFNPNSASRACQADRSPDNPHCIDFGGADWSTGLARSPDLINWVPYAQNPVLPTTMRSFGYDGAEFVRTPDGLLHLYYRAPGPGNQTKRATLQGVVEP